MEDSTTGVDELSVDATMEVCDSACAAAKADMVDRPSQTGDGEADTIPTGRCESRSRTERGQAASKKLPTIAVAQPVSVLATSIRGNNKILDSSACMRMDLGGPHCGKNGSGASDSSEESPATSSRNPTPNATVAPMLQPGKGRTVRVTHPVPNVTLTSNNRLVPTALCDRTRTSSVKPDCSYNCLIGMALLAHGRLPVSGIYSYIQYHFPYFKTRAPEGWKNSVRHSLSLGTYFRKAIPLPKLQKGFYWEIAPHGRERIQTEVENFIKVAQNNFSVKPILPTLKELHLEGPSPSKLDPNSSENGATKNGQLSTPAGSPSLGPSLSIGSPLSIAHMQPTLSSLATDRQLLEKYRRQQTEPLREQTEDPFETLTTSPAELTVLLNSLSQIFPTQESDPYNVSSVTHRPAKVLDTPLIPPKQPSALPKVSTAPPKLPIIPLVPPKLSTAPPKASTAPPKMLTIPLGLPKLSTARLRRPQVLDARDNQGQPEGAVSTVVARVVNILQHKQPSMPKEPEVSVNKASEGTPALLQHSTALCEQQEKEKDGPKESGNAPPLADSQWEEVMDKNAAKQEEATISATISGSLTPDKLKGTLPAEDPPEPQQLKDPDSHNSTDVAPQSITITATMPTEQPTPYALLPVANVCHSLDLPQQLPKAHVPESKGGGSHVPAAAPPTRANAKGNLKKRRGRKTLRQRQEKRIFPVYPRMAYAYVPSHGFAPYPPVHMWSTHHLAHSQPMVPLGSYYHTPGAWQYPYAQSVNVMAQQARSNAKEASKDDNPRRDDVHSAQQLQAAWQAARYAQFGMQHVLPRSYCQGVYPYPVQTHLQPSMLNPIPFNNFASPTSTDNETNIRSDIPIPVISTKSAQSHVENQEDTSGSEAELKPTDQKRPKLQQKMKTTKGKIKAAGGKQHEPTTYTSELEPPPKQRRPRWGSESPLEGPQDTSLTNTQSPTVDHSKYLGSEAQRLNSSPVHSESNQAPSCMEFNVDQLIQALEETEHYLKLQIHQVNQDVAKASPRSQGALGATTESNSVSSEGLTSVSEDNATSEDISVKVCEEDDVAATQNYMPPVCFKELLPVNGSEEPRRDASLPNSGPLPSCGSV